MPSGPYWAWRAHLRPLPLSAGWRGVLTASVWSWRLGYLPSSSTEKKQDLIATGFLVFAIGEGIILSCAAMDLAASVPSFGAGIGLWALALLLISLPRVFPVAVRLLGLFAAALFGITALRIFAGVQVTPLTTPLPFYA